MAECPSGSDPAEFARKLEAELEAQRRRLDEVEPEELKRILRDQAETTAARQIAFEKLIHRFLGSDGFHSMLVEMTRPCWRLPYCVWAIRVDLPFLEAVARPAKGPWSVTAASWIRDYDPRKGLGLLLLLLDQGDEEARRSVVSHVWNMSRPQIAHPCTAEGVAEARAWIEEQAKSL